MQESNPNVPNSKSELDSSEIHVRNVPELQKRKTPRKDFSFAKKCRNAEDEAKKSSRKRFFFFMDKFMRKGFKFCGYFFNINSNRILVAAN